MKIPYGYEAKLAIPLQEGAVVSEEFLSRQEMVDAIRTALIETFIELKGTK
jgi:hypothetical protein